MYTFELYPDPSTGLSRFYPPDEVIGRETSRNREAVLYLITQADCPYRAIGKTQTHCGALFDDFEVGRGWQLDPYRTDTATSGRWQRSDPQPTSYGGAKQLGTPTSGWLDLVTGASAGRYASDHDVDGGTTSVISPVVKLPAGPGQRLSFRYYLAHSANSTSADYFRISVVGSSRVTVFEERGGAFDDDAAWGYASINMNPFAGQTIRVLIEARESRPGVILEAAVDDVRITRPTQ